MKQIYIYYMFMMIMLILVMIMILVSVAFLTLLERKMLSYIQIRKGPNKLGYMGILQPFSDAIKLLSKEINLLYKMNYLYYFITPLVMFILTLMMWLIYPFYTNLLIMNLGFIYLMCCFSINVYSLLMTGWSSNSFYSLLGSIRSLCQSISYEVSLALLMMIFIMLIESFNLNNLINFQENLMMIFYLTPLSFMFLISLMAELNRTPFDFSEGESELVSGFNIEYMSTSFVLIFLSEYLSILFMSLLFSMFFLGSSLYSFMFYIKIMMMVFFVIWVRGSMPRFRYDFLMYLCWLVILPFILNYMFYMFFLKILI